MVTKIYGFNPIVYFVCKEFDIPFEAAPVSLSTGEHKSPEWLETMQPFGQVPVLVVRFFFPFRRRLSFYIFLPAESDSI